MTIEEKAKAYDNALEKARSFELPEYRRIMKELFPELRESKDERIMKVIIGLLKQSTYEDCYYDGINMRDIYEYLEKQCGQKPIGKMQVSEKLYEHIKNTCNCIDDALSSETFADITDYLEMASKDAQDAFDMIEKQGERKLNWNEEDEQIANNIRMLIEKYAFSQSAVDVNGDLCEKIYIDMDNWLKSLKEKIR